MAISIDWANKIIYIPKNDLTLIQSTPTEIRELDLNQFRLELKSLEDDEEGMPFLDTHRHNTEVDIGGLTLARVVEIINGYTVTFEDGQYAVNLVGANSNVGDKVNVNQVSVRSFNSAGMTSSPAIEYASYNGGVTVDVVNGVAGTVYNKGTPQNPVNNMQDAILIANYRGFITFYINNNITLDIGTDFSKFRFIGSSKTLSTITITDNANVENCEFYDAEVKGTLDGGNVLRGCLIKNLNYVNGFIEQCVLGSGTITLGGNAEAHFLDCWSGVVGSSTPTIDMGGSGQGLGLRNYNGGIKITNKSGPEKISIDLNSGQVILGSDVTAGEIIIRGIGKVTDWLGNRLQTGTWNGGVTLDVDDLVSPPSIVSDVVSAGIFLEMNERLKRSVGLLHENFFIDLPTFDSDNNMTSARVRIYSDAGSVGTDNNVIGTYMIEVSPTGPGKFLTWKQYRDS